MSTPTYKLLSDTLQQVRFYTDKDPYYYTIDNRPLEDLDYNVHQLISVSDASRRAALMDALADSAMLSGIFGFGPARIVGLDCTATSEGIVSIAPGIMLFTIPLTEGSTVDVLKKGSSPNSVSLNVPSPNLIAHEVYHLIQVRYVDGNTGSALFYEDLSNEYLASTMLHGKLEYSVVTGVEAPTGTGIIPTANEGWYPLFHVKRIYNDPASYIVRHSNCPARASFATNFFNFVTVEETTTARTASLEDTRAYVVTTNDSDITVTIPDQDTVPWMDTSELVFEQGGLGQIIFVGAAGVTLQTPEQSFPQSRTRHSVVGLKRVGYNLWTLTGDLENSSSSPYSSVSVKSETAITLGGNDVGTYLMTTSPDPVTLTLPSQAIAGWSADVEIFIEQNGTGEVTISPAAGVTIHYASGKLPTILGQYSTVRLKRTSENIWTLDGSLKPINNSAPDLTRLAIFEAAKYGLLGGTGVDEAANIQEALDACGAAGGGVVVVRSFTENDPVYVNSAIQVSYSNVILQFESDLELGPNGIIRVKGADSTVVANVTADVLPGDTQVAVDATTGFSSGDDLIVIEDDLLESDLDPLSTSTTKVRAEVGRVNALGANSITFERSLAREYEVTQSAKITKINAVKNCGVIVKNVRWTAAQTTEAAFLLYGCVNSFVSVKNVEGASGLVNSAIKIERSLDTHCFGVTIEGAQAEGASPAENLEVRQGVVLKHSAFCSVYDTNISSLRHNFALVGTTECRVYDCVSEDAYQAGIYVIGTGNQGYRLYGNQVLSGSTTYALDKRGIRIGTYSYVNGVLGGEVYRNRVSGYSGATDVGIYILPSCASLSVEDNVVDQSNTGIEIRVSADNVANPAVSATVLLSGNDYTQCVRPVDISETSTMVLLHVSLCGDRSINNGAEHFVVDGARSLLIKDCEIVTPTDTLSSIGYHLTGVDSLRVHGNMATGVYRSARLRNCTSPVVTYNFFGGATNADIDSDTSNTDVVAFANTDVPASGQGVSGVSLYKNPESFLVYLGQPNAYRNLWVDNLVSAEISKYDNWVVGPDYQDPLNAQHETTQGIIDAVKSTGTAVWGYIPASVTTDNLSLAQIETRISNWKAMGVYGIYLGKFGFEHGVSRQRQIDIVNLIKAEDLRYAAEVSTPEDLLVDGLADLPAEFSQARKDAYAAGNVSNLTLPRGPLDVGVLYGYGVSNTGVKEYTNFLAETVYALNMNSALLERIKLCGLAVVATSGTLSDGYRVPDLSYISPFSRIDDLTKYVTAGAIVHQLDGIGVAGSNLGSDGYPVEFSTYDPLEGVSGVSELVVDGVGYSHTRNFGAVSVKIYTGTAPLVLATTNYVISKTTEGSLPETILGEADTTVDYIKPIYITGFGDSRTSQNWNYAPSIPAPLARGFLWWAETLSRRVRLDYRYNQGRSGDTVSDLRARIENNTLNDYGYSPSGVPVGPATLHIGTNDLSSVTTKAEVDAVLVDYEWVLHWMIDRGHKVLAICEWPRTGLTADQQKLLMYFAESIRRFHDRKNVWVIDVWRLATDPASTDGSPLAGMLDGDGLHNSPGIAFITGKAIAAALSEMGYATLAFRPSSNGDVYDAVLNTRGCLNNNPMLRQGAGGTLGTNVTGLAPEGYTINVSSGLSAVGSFVTTEVNGEVGLAYRLVVTGTPTTTNGYVQLRQSGLHTKVAAGDTLSAGYECYVNDGHVNFSAPGLMIDTGVSASRVHGGLSLTGDSMMPASVVQPYYACPRSGRYVVPTTLPTTLALDIRAYFTLSGVSSSVTIDLLSAWVRKI